MFRRDRIGPAQPPQQRRSNAPQRVESRKVHLWPAVLKIAVEEQDPAQHFPARARLRVATDQPVPAHVTVEQPGHARERHDRSIAGLGDAILELVVADLS